MTDTTAPNAITQAEELRQPWGLALSTSDLDRLYNDSKYDIAPVGSEVRQLVAEVRHRRLAAHGAGEGLREALMSAREWVASLTVTDMNEIVADGGITAGMVVGQEAAERLRRIDRALTLSTDSGSVMCSGGDGVEICPSCDGSGEGVADTVCTTCEGSGGIGGALARAKERQAARDASGDVHVEGSIYEGMEASLQRGGRTIAHVARYADAVEIAAALATTPPTDAGSTTREGGEGVLTEREACARIADELADDPHDIGAKIAARIRNRTEQDSFLALATTSSPDASPDSGAAYAEIKQAWYDGRASGLASPDFNFEKVEAVWREAVTRILASAAASPASLSGGAEEVDWRKVAKLAGEHGVRYRTNAGMAKFIAALHPSPEAPANRQEAGEVERLRGQQEGFAAAVAQLREMSATKPRAALHHEAAILADQLERSRIPGSTLTSPKDVKGGEGNA